MLSLKSIISAIDGVSIVGEAYSIKDAYRLTMQEAPDVLFLDIHFPDGSGIELAEKLVSSEMEIAIVFVTADAGFSLDAHKMYSYDYILKPIDESRMIRTILRLKKDKDRKSNMENSEGEPKHLLVRKGEETIVLEQDQILFIEKAGKKATVYCYDCEYLVYGTLEQIEKKLNKSFFRSHKSYIINTMHVKKILQWNNQTYQVRFNNSDKIACLSRRKYRVLMDKFA